MRRSPCRPESSPECRGLPPAAPPRRAGAALCGAGGQLSISHPGPATNGGGRTGTSAGTQAGLSSPLCSCLALHCQQSLSVIRRPVCLSVHSPFLLLSTCFSPPLCLSISVPSPSTSLCLSLPRPSPLLHLFQSLHLPLPPSSVSLSLLPTPPSPSPHHQSVSVSSSLSTSFLSSLPTPHSPCLGPPLPPQKGLKSQLTCFLLLAPQWGRYITEHRLSFLFANLRGGRGAETSYELGLLG